MEYLQYRGIGVEVRVTDSVLNLVISGIPSILEWKYTDISFKFRVLNLVISGIPSIH